MTRNEIITLMTSIVLGETGEALSYNALGRNATIVIDNIRF